MTLKQKLLELAAEFEAVEGLEVQGSVLRALAETIPDPPPPNDPDDPPGGDD